MFNHIKHPNELNCAIYARKSNEAEERQIHSIEDQEIETAKIVEQHQLNVVYFASDEKSAKDAFQRSGFSDLIVQINEGSVNALVVWKLNRLARNGTEAGLIIDLLLSKKLAAIITPGKTYLPSENPMLMYIEFGIAQNTSKDISSDVMRGQRRKAQRGWHPISVLGMGYKHNRDYKDSGGDAIIADKQFHLVQQLWQETLRHHYSFSDIKRRGDELGIRKLNGKKNKGGKYTLNSFRRTFTDPFYASGEFYWNTDEGVKERYIGKHQKMLSEQDFNLIQINLGKRGRPTRINKYDFPLSGCLSCGGCGCAMTYERVFRATCSECKKRFSLKNRTDCPYCHIEVSEMSNPYILDKTYMRCTKKRGKCPQKYILASEIEQQFQDKLSEVQISQEFHDWAIAAFEYLNREEISEQDNFNRHIDKLETDLLDQSRRLSRMRLKGEVSGLEYLDLKSEIKEELADTVRQRKNFHNRVIDWGDIAIAYTQYAHVAPKTFKNASNEKKHAILRTFGSNLNVIDGKLDFSTPKALSTIHFTHGLSVGKNISLEPQKDFENKGQNGPLEPHISFLCAELRKVRTHILEQEYHNIPDFIANPEN